MQRVCDYVEVRAGPDLHGALRLRIVLRGAGRAGRRARDRGADASREVRADTVGGGFGLSGSCLLAPLRCPAANEPECFQVGHNVDELEY